MATTAEPQPDDHPGGRAEPTTAKGWGTDAPDQPLRPMEFERRALRPDDVAIKITYAGICHSDLHTCRNDWEGTDYPVIPGHEIVGTVTADRKRSHPPPASATRSRSAAWSTAAWNATSASPAGKCSAARAASRPTTAPTITTARSPRAATPTTSSSATISSSRSPKAWTSAASRLCCARASPPTRRCASMMSGRARRWRSSASAASATWA